jgi:hypothetical protein
MPDDVLHHHGNYLVRRLRLAPGEGPHRAINTGRQAYEEITIFFLDRPDAVAQPSAESE